jgi:hypothetical protein
MFDWVTSNALSYIGMGTHLKFYINIGDDFYDVTPIRETSIIDTDPFAVTSGSTTVTVTDTTHGAVQFDFVTYSGATGPIGGVPASEFNIEHQILSVIDDDTYTIEVVTAGTSTVSGGGAAVTAEYQINVGLNIHTGIATGWSWGYFGQGPWGGGFTISANNRLRLYSQDNFGNDLVWNVRGGGVFYWTDADGGAVARSVELSSLPGASDTPVVALQVLVSEVDRHIIAFGTPPIGSSDLDPLFIRWSDQESAADWTPTASSTAGGVRLSSGSAIVGALQVRQEILIWTDSDLHSMRYLGDNDLIFQFDILHNGTSMASPRAAAHVNGVVYYMDVDGFYIYAGAVEPIPCDILDYILEDFDQSQSFKVVCGTNREFYEVMWFYQSVGATGFETDKYVTYNYLEKVWYFGTIERTEWIDKKTIQKPIAAAVDSNGDPLLYVHEQGHDADDGPMTAYIESGEFDLDDGEFFQLIYRVGPDFHFNGITSAAEVDLELKGVDYPLNTETTLVDVKTVPTTGQHDVRARARALALRLESSGEGYGWRMGDFRLDIRDDGRR